MSLTIATDDVIETEVPPTASWRRFGVVPDGGHMMWSSLLELTQDEKTTVKAGAVPATWSKAKRAQMDTDGRWTLKRGRRRSALPATRPAAGPTS